VRLFLQPITEPDGVPSPPKCAHGRDLLRGARLLECANAGRAAQLFKFVRRLIGVRRTYMRSYFRVLCVAVIYACASSAAQTEMQFEFGKLRAEVNGRAFTGVFGPNSIIAVWDTTVGQMQIQGDKRVRGRGTELVRVTMRCGAVPKRGNYAIRNPFSPVSSEAFIAPTGWQRIWPLRGSSNRPFLSDSMPPGTLVLERVDSVIQGRFDVTLRSFNRTPAETLHVRGTFFGRLDVQPRYPRPRAHWAPEFHTDCERIRDAVPM
jgi:hypothetical protein